jgi:hypothetical protein
MSDPDEDGPPPSLRHGFPLGFWLALAFGLACVVGGLLFARLG